MPTIEEAFAASSVVVYGEVTDTTPCLSGRPWTFIELDVLNVVRGELDPSALQGGMSSSSFAYWGDEVWACYPEADGHYVINTPSGLDDGGTPLWSWEPDPFATESCLVEEDWTNGGGGSTSSLLSSGTFTFRLPYGPFGDGTFGTIIDTPALRVGDEVVLFLTYDPDGSHRLIPLHWMGWSVYRVFRGETGGTAIVNGFGQPLFRSGFGQPVVGVGQKTLRSLYYTDAPLDEGDVGDTLVGLANAATWNGTGQAKGVWHGALAVSVTGDADSDCVADLHGLVNAAGNAIALEGWCNADYAGRVDIDLTGIRTGTTWSGTVTFTPLSMPNESRQIPWSSDQAFPDMILASEGDDYSEGGYDFDYTGHLTAGFIGRRPLMTLAQFAGYLTDLADDHQASAGIAYSLGPNATTCDPDIDIVQADP